MRVKFLSLILAFLLFSIHALASVAGQLDLTFNNTGTVFSPLSGLSQIDSLVPLPDGGVLVGGFFKGLNGNKTGFLARYNQSGQPVSSFGDNGIKTLNIELPNPEEGILDHEVTVAFVSGDKVLVGGYVNVLKNEVVQKKFMLGRLKLADGSLDETFNNGKLIVRELLTQVENSPDIFVRDLKVQADGKIIVALNIVQPPLSIPINDFRSSDEENLKNAILLARFNLSGTLDENFGNKQDVDGRGLRFLNGFYVYNNSLAVKSIAIQKDNKIILGGSVENDKYVALARLDSEGVTLDSSFSNRSAWVYDLSNGNQKSQLSSIILQPDNKILIAGTANGDFAVARCAVDCQSDTEGLDSSFGNNGVQLTDIGQGTEDSLSGIALQPNGKIIAVGETTQNSLQQTRLALVRYNSDGNRDTSFNENGILTAQFAENKDSHGYAITSQSDEKILIAGGVDTKSGGGDSQFVLARFFGKTVAETVVVNPPSSTQPKPDVSGSEGGSSSTEPLAAGVNVSSGGCHITSGNSSSFLLFFVALIPLFYFRFRKIEG